jgi:hypothetical protein
MLQGYWFPHKFREKASPYREVLCEVPARMGHEIGQGSQDSEKLIVYYGGIVFFG